jgi:hypothetical protein
MVRLARSRPPPANVVTFVTTEEPIGPRKENASMVYQGTVKNGTVVLEPGAEIPEGTKVRVEMPGLGIGEESFQSVLREPTFDDAIEKLYLLYKVNRGIRQADAGLTVSHEEARERLKKWLE